MVITGRPRQRSRISSINVAKLRNSLTKVSRHRRNRLRMNPLVAPLVFSLAYWFLMLSFY
ncbi:hypothetical protein BDW74DRAFT_162214 [Aspergillus multicolor]|uniref:uncharacterized protein n=1 Tax=Aspergillus multicolor TaxID=41759 RepID=UPI003CCD532E